MDLIHAYEKYLKEDLRKNKKKIKDIEVQLLQIKNFKSLSLDQRRDRFNLNDSQNNLSLNGSHISTSNYYLNKSKHYYMKVEENSQKEALICQLFNSIRIESSIIYCNKLETVARLTTLLLDNDIQVLNFVGKKSDFRRKVIDKFNKDELVNISALITVRPLKELRNISLFINYEMPTENTFLQKFGSTRKKKFKYLVLNLTNGEEFKKLEKYSELHEFNIQQFPVRNGSQPLVNGIHDDHD